MRSLLCILAASASASAAAQPAWQLSSRPVVEIGDEADIQTQFNGVRGILRLPTGDIVVANGRSQELRVFSATGKHLRTLSRKGRGPGEFEQLGRIWRSGDTIYAEEPNLGAAFLQVYTPQKFVRKHSLRAPELGRGGAALNGRFPSGRFAAAPGMRVYQDFPAGRIIDDSTDIAVLSVGEPNIVVLIGKFVATQMVTYPSPFVPDRSAAWSYPFGHATAFAVSGDRLWVGDNQSGEIALFDDRGQKTTSFDVPIPARPLDAALIRSLRATQPGKAENRMLKAAMEAVYSAPLPKLAPRFSSFLPGVDGEVWIEKYNEAPSAPRSYVVVSRAGKATGTMVFPMNVVPHEIGRDYVLAVHTDDDGLEHVQMYSLSRR